MADSNKRYLKLNKELIEYIKENCPNSFIFFIDQINDNFYEIIVDLKLINWIETKLKSTNDSDEQKLLNNLLAEFHNLAELDKNSNSRGR